MPVSVVVFDVGETLIDETRMWGDWADWLGVPRLTFFAVLGAVIERGASHRVVFEHFRPGFDLQTARRERAAAGIPDVSVKAEDFYADALPCLRELKARGYRIGLAGNQPAEVEEQLLSCGVTADFVASSESWGVAKPDQEFFQRIIATAGVRPGDIAYVGDRLDNDVMPAAQAGLVAVFLKRGPWGQIQPSRWDTGNEALIMNSLVKLPEALAGI
jgi:FMN phosphatase YigB (HAD superfamily)